MEDKIKSSMTEVYKLLKAGKIKEAGELARSINTTVHNSPKAKNKSLNKK